MKHEMETLLRATPLQKPSGQLDENVQQLFDTANKESAAGRWRLVLAITCSAAATLLIMFAAQSFFPAKATPARTKTPQPAASYTPAATAAANNTSRPKEIKLASTLEFDPVRIEQVDHNVDYEGTVEVDGGESVDLFRQRTTRKILLVDEDRGIQLEMNLPYEDVVMVSSESF